MNTSKRASLSGKENGYAGDLGMVGGGILSAAVVATSSLTEADEEPRKYSAKKLLLQMH